MFLETVNAYVIFKFISAYFLFLLTGAPRNADFDGSPPTVVSINSKGHFSFKLTAYPTPVVQKLIYLGNNENSDGHLAKENSISVECTGSWLAPATVICTIRVVNITHQDEGFYKVDLSNSEGEMSFIFSVKRKRYFTKNNELLFICFSIVI